MILIFFTWIVMCWFFLSTGIFFKSFLKLSNIDLPITVFLGMFLQCLMLSICCFFTKIGLEILLLNLCCNVFLFFYFRKKIIIDCREFIFEIKKTNIYSKSILILILVLSLYKCSLKPFLIDNESYYIQTIKWINEYGFVKGLANLHIFLAQMSPLHVLQAGFNFSFLTNNINDINGLILMISSLFFVIKAEKYYAENQKFSFLNFLLIFNFLYFQFIGQPSPDFILMIISQIIFYLYLEENKNQDALKTSIFLFLFIVFVKITIAPIGLLLVIWMIQLRKYFKIFVISSTLILLILIVKNSNISGYPFYPFDFYSINVDWKIPENLFNFITDSTKNTGYFENQVIVNPTFFQKIIGWLNLSGLNRIFNFGMLLLFVLTLFTPEFRKSKIYQNLYFIILIHFFVLLFTSPQFRYFLPQFIFFTVLIIANFANYFKLNYSIVQISVLIFIIFSCIFIEYYDFKNITDNKLMQQNSSFTFKNFLIPEKNSKYDAMTFEKVKNGNLNYYSPTTNFFFFGTADGKLPCVNKYQIDYLEKYYFIKPQMRTDKVSDGFYSEILKTE